MQKIFTFNTEPETDFSPDHDSIPADRFKHELIEQAYRHLPAGLFANFGLSLLVVAGLSGTVTTHKLLIWFAVIWVFNIIRAFIIRAYNRSAPEEKIRPHWGVFFSIGVFLSGICWGLSPLYIFAKESIPHQTFLVFVIGGLIAGGSTSLASTQKTYRAFVFLTGVPVTIKFILIGGDTHIPMAMMLIVYMIICTILSSHVQAMLLVSLKLRMENREVQKKLLQNERLAAIGKLSGSVAHDLRNPLGSISNSVFFLSHKVEAKPGSKVKKHLGLMDREIERANSIITGLLDVSIKNDPILEIGEINILIKSLLEDLQIPDNIKLNIDLGHDLPLFRFDQSQIQRIIMNLVKNSFQAMPDGGSMSISTSLQDNYLKLEVKDNGFGIDPEVIPEVFEPLFTTKTRGVGLGLSIVKTFVEKHKGHIEISSVVDHGTTVSVFIPMDL